MHMYAYQHGRYIRMYCIARGPVFKVIDSWRSDVKGSGWGASKKQSSMYMYSWK